MNEVRTEQVVLMEGFGLLGFGLLEGAELKTVGFPYPSIPNCIGGETPRIIGQKHGE